MKLHYKLRNFCCTILLVMLSVFLSFSLFSREQTVFADDENGQKEDHFVTIYDSGTEVTVKTASMTVKDVLEKVQIDYDESDIVEPGLDSMIDSDNYRINVYRARPVIVKDGAHSLYLMSASYDPKSIAREAGLTIYDGDEIKVEFNQNFLEAGAASTYTITRNGGRRVTVEEIIPYSVETRYDYNLAQGERYLEQAGEDGRKVTVYEARFEDNREVERTLVSEEVKVEPVPEIVVVGAKLSIAPEQETCVSWLREAGIAESDLEAAIYIIYHESGCRVDARNAYSGAYGIPQALPGTKMATAGADWETNPITQIRWMDSYVKGRYGSWQAALNFKLERGWY